MTFARITQGRLDWLSERLGSRDFELLQTLGRVRVASTRQLERLHFFEGTPLSNARSCRATLTRLARLRVVTRLERRVGGVRAGSAGYIYALGVAGQRLLATGGPARGGRYQRPWTPSNSFLNHQLAVTEQYVLFSERCRLRGLHLEAFDTEPTCWRSFNGGAGESITLKPDAFTRLSGPTFMDHYFLEVDLGTESPAALQRKFDRYRLYWAAGLEQKRHSVFPKVLWLVPDQKRLKTLVDVAAIQPAEAWQLFQVTTLEEGASVLTGGGDD